MEMKSNTVRSVPMLPLFAGALFTLVGIMLTLDNLDLAEAEPVLRFWPVALIAAGVAKLIERGNRFASLALIVVGALLLADNLSLVRLSLFDFWPLILIGIGATFVARSLGANPVSRLSEGSSGSSFALLAERNVRITESDYRGGNASAFMGSLKLDLTDADITSGPAVLNANAMWGSIEIIVPDRWEVVADVTPFMAAFEMRMAGSPPDPSRRLIVRGGALWAGIEVKSASRRSA